VGGQVKSDNMDEDNWSFTVLVLHTGYSEAIPD
jgi:hypothetical protein